MTVHIDEVIRLVTGRGIVCCVLSLYRSFQLPMGVAAVDVARTSAVALEQPVADPEPDATHA